MVHGRQRRSLAHLQKGRAKPCEDLFRPHLLLSATWPYLARTQLWYWKTILRNKESVNWELAGLLLWSFSIHSPPTLNCRCSSCWRPTRRACTRCHIWSHATRWPYSRLETERNEHRVKRIGGRSTDNYTSCVLWSSNIVFLDSTNLDDWIPPKSLALWIRVGFDFEFMSFTLSRRESSPNAPSS